MKVGCTGYEGTTNRYWHQSTRAASSLTRVKALKGGMASHGTADLATPLH